MQLRPYQIDALSRSKEAYDKGINRQLAVLATGLGKTAIAANLRAHHGFTKPIIFLVHMETLAVQAATAMQRWNPDLRVGVEMAGSYADMDGFYPPQFIVASVPTLGRKGSDRIKRFLPGDFAAVIQDEAHIWAWRTRSSASTSTSACWSPTLTGCCFSASPPRRTGRTGRGCATCSTPSCSTWASRRALPTDGCATFAASG